MTRRPHHPTNNDQDRWSGNRDRSNDRQRGNSQLHRQKVLSGKSTSNAAKTTSTTSIFDRRIRHGIRTHYAPNQYQNSCGKSHGRNNIRRNNTWWFPNNIGTTMAKEAQSRNRVENTRNTVQLEILPEKLNEWGSHSRRHHRRRSIYTKETKTREHKYNNGYSDKKES